VARNARVVGRVGPGVMVRVARPDELDDIGDLRVAAYRADGFLPATSGYVATLRALGADGQGEVLAAVDGGQIVGTVMLLGWPAGQMARGPGEADVRALAVAPQARGRGVGAALVAAVIERAAGRGIRQLVLLTLPQMRAAHHLYTQAGFRRLPDRDRLPRPGEVLLAYGLVLAPGPGAGSCPAALPG
jgi:ribosomal protein S18 acetylase RimI-like enzyme